MSVYWILLSVVLVASVIMVMYDDRLSHGWHTFLAVVLVTASMFLFFNALLGDDPVVRNNDGQSSSTLVSHPLAGSPGHQGVW